MDSLLDHRELEEGQQPEEKEQHGRERRGVGSVEEAERHLVDVIEEQVGGIVGTTSSS